MFLLLSFLAQASTGTSNWTDLTGQNSNNSCIVDGVPTLKCLEVVFGNILFMTSALIILILFIMFLWGGFTYLTSFGSPDKVKKAQGTIRYAVIGLIIYISAFLILKTIDFLFLGNEGKIFKFEIGSTLDQGSGSGGYGCQTAGTSVRIASECCSNATTTSPNGTLVCR